MLVVATHMPSAAEQYTRNLDFFISLPGLLRTSPSAKLQFDSGTGLFALDTSSGLSRTWYNIGKSAAQKKSITNAASFRDPVLAVFRQASEQRVDVQRRRSAYQGLAALRAVYAADRDKSAVLQGALTEILQYIPSALIEETERLFREIEPRLVLSDMDLAFMDKVWDNRAELQKLLRQGEARDRANDNNNRPYASLTSSIYNLYSKLDGIEPTIASPNDWMQGLPPDRKGNYRLQHNNRIVSGKAPDQVLKFGPDFIYYNAPAGKKASSEQVWRIYLNFEPDAARTIIGYLNKACEVFAIHSFKICTPAMFSTRVDKVVIYVVQRSREALCDDIVRHARDFRLKDPVPPMTQRLAPGIATGVEPKPVDLGLSYAVEDKRLVLSPDKLKQKSYGSIRAELIAAALTQMNAVTFADARQQTAYREDKSVFLKWVAVAFHSYASELDPTRRA
jgi:hypothetical protein